MPQRRTYHVRKRTRRSDQTPLLFQDNAIEPDATWTLDSEAQFLAAEESGPRVDRQHNSLLRLAAGIDDDIKQLFLKLPPDKLAIVFRMYGAQYGPGKLSYATSTYPNWVSGRTRMSGLVVARLLDLVPRVLDADVQYKLVKKLRTTYIRKESIDIHCDPSDWFKKVPLVVGALIERSCDLQLPPEVVEKLSWLMNGDALAAQQILATAEIEEARLRTQYLAREYAIIGRMLSTMQVRSSFVHTIELPQGTVKVTVMPLKLGLLQRLPYSPINPANNKRHLSLVCKNSHCSAELETQLSVYDGEPIVCTPGEVSCPVCGSTYVYSEADLSRARKNLNVEVIRGIWGKLMVGYDCPFCSARLTSRLDEAGTIDACPKCHRNFVVPHG